MFVKTEIAGGIKHHEGGGLSQISERVPLLVGNEESPGELICKRLGVRKAELTFGKSR